MDRMQRIPGEGLKPRRIPKSSSRSCAGKYGPGTLSLLEGPSITALVQDIRVAGQQVDGMGRLTGERETHEVAVEHTEGGGSRYAVGLPAVGVGLLIVRRVKEGES